MTSATKKAKKALPAGFASGPSVAPATARGGDALNDNVRLLVDAVRRLVEVQAQAVRMLVTCETYANCYSMALTLGPGLRRTRRRRVSTSTPLRSLRVAY